MPTNFLNDFPETRESFLEDFPKELPKEKTPFEMANEIGPGIPEGPYAPDPVLAGVKNVATAPVKFGVSSAAKLNEGMASLANMLDDAGDYIGEKTGLNKVKGWKGGLFEKAAKEYEQNAEVWNIKLKEYGTDAVNELLASAAGGAVPGVTEFMLNVPFAALRGATEAKKEGTSELHGAATEGAKRLLLGKIFNALGQVKQPYRSAGMGAVMGSETAVSGGSPGEIAQAVGVGGIFGLRGKGKLGPKDIARNLRGKTPTKIKKSTDFLKEFSDAPQGSVPGGMLAYGQALPKMAGNINLERIDTGYAPKKIIADTALMFKGKIDKARRGKITLEQTKLMAEELGIKEKTLLSRKRGEAWNAEQILGARHLLNNSANRVIEAQTKAAQTQSIQDLANFRMALSRHAAVQSEVAGLAAEAGRALSAHRILSKNITTEAKSQQAMLDALGGREVTEDILRSMSQIDLTNMREVNQFIMKFSKVKTSDMIFEAWVNFLLSGPKTHVVNATSNTMTFLTKPVESLIAAGYETARAKVTGTPKERFMRESVAKAASMRMGLKEGVRAALKGIREDIPADTLMKIEARKYKAIPGKTGRIIRIPGTALIAADEFFKSINYYAEMHSLAYRAARIEGKKGNVAFDRAAEIIANPTEGMMEKSRYAAQYRTFTKPYGPWGRKLEQVRRIPGVRYLVPFMRTPTNIAKFALERTPANFLRLGHKIAKGELKGSEISDEMAKPILGSMLMMGIVALAQEGLVTGGGPKEKNERDTLYRTGWRPYALKVGDKYYSYGRLEPIGSIFGMAADYTEITGNQEFREQKFGDVSEAILLSLGKNLTSKTYLEGISNAMDAISDPKRYGANWVERFGSSAVPSAVNTLRQATDPNLRQVEGIPDALLNRMPYLSQTLAVRRDIWGREVKVDGSWVQRSMSPFPVGIQTNDPVDLELARLLKTTGEALGYPSRKIKGIKLTPIEYDLFLKRSGERSYEMVRKVVERGINGDDQIKIKVIKRVISRVRAAERKRFYLEFLHNNPARR